MSMEASNKDSFGSGRKMYTFLNRTGALDARKSDELFENWLQNLTYGDYEQYLTRLNGMMREIPLRQRSADGKDVTVSLQMGPMDAGVSYIPPQEDQKQPMMRKVFDAMKQLPSNDDRALLVYYAIQAIHPFADGNGRVGRLVYTLMSETGKTLTLEELSALLDHENLGGLGTGKGRDTFAEAVMEPKLAYYLINREMAKEVFGARVTDRCGNIFFSAQLGGGYVPDMEGVSESEVKFARKILGEGDVPNFSFRSIVALRMVESDDKFRDALYAIQRPVGANEGVPEDAGKKVVGIDHEKFGDHLNQADLKRLVDIHRDVKVRFVDEMIDVFVNPEKHAVRSTKGEIVAIKDLLRRDTDSELFAEYR